MRRNVLLALTVGLAAVGMYGQSAKELAVIRQIKVEAFENSKVMDHLANLTDLYGPRLTASPEWEEAAQ